MRPIALVAAAGLLLATGCATIMHGTTQDVGFSSTPSQATVKVNGIPVGATPVVAKLERKQSHLVRLELDGYQPFETTLTKSVSGWVWGNIVFGGLIGLAVDASTGGIYKLSPTQMHGQLSQTVQAGTPRGSETSSALGKDGIYVRVVMQADPAWTKVGQLERE